MDDRKNKRQCETEGCRNGSPRYILLFSVFYASLALSISTLSLLWRVYSAILSSAVW